MPKPNLNSMPGYKARMPKQAHDLTQSTAFTSSTGMLLPVYYDMLHPGDEIHFSGNMFTRLNPLSVASLAEIDIHLDYFFVPLPVIYTPFPSMMYQTDDLLSSAFKQDGIKFSSSSFPKLDLDASIRATLDGGKNLSSPTSDILPVISFDCVGKSVLRLCDMLDYNPYQLFSNTDVTANPVTTPWFLSAYHCIYYESFRNDDREPYNYFWQLDKYATLTTSSPTNFDGFTDANFLYLHYCSAYKDYFNSIKVSPVSSSISFLNSSASFSLLSNVNSYIFSSPSYSVAGSTGNGDFNSLSVGDVTTVKSVQGISSSYPVAGLSSANIRQLFMVDKLLRITGRANKNYESQFLAHFGIEVPHDAIHNITHIGHDKVTLRPQAVISSADTFNGETGSALGEVGGQGYVSLSGKKRKFTAPIHGVFMVIYHANPRFRYNAGISKLHDLSDPMKFWQPEYDRKGMQPLFGYEIYKSSNIQSGNSVSRFGWQFAYEQFKRKYDKVSDAFALGLTDPAGTPVTVNTYNPWVLSRVPFSVPTLGNLNFAKSSLNYGDFLTGSNFLNGIMQVYYQTTLPNEMTFVTRHLAYHTDPFIHDFRLDCSKVNMMSEYGEPELD